MGVEGLRFVITGSGTGIGAATALLAAAKGAKVMVSDLNDDNGNRIVAEIRSAGGTAEYTHCDVTAEGDVSALMDATAVAFGGIDVLHNNAGIHDTMVSATPTLEGMDAAAFRKVIEVNAIAPWVCSKYALPHLKKSTNASIINAASTGALVAYANNNAYGTSKGGIMLLTKNLAVDLAPFGIRVNCYCPTAIETQMVSDYIAGQSDPGAFLKSLTSTSLIPRLGRPSEVAELVCFLASAEAGFINGAAISIDGGSLAWRGTVDQLGM